MFWRELDRPGGVSRVTGAPRASAPRAPPRLLRPHGLALPPRRGRQRSPQYQTRYLTAKAPFFTNHQIIAQLDQQISSRLTSNFI